MVQVVTQPLSDRGVAAQTVSLGSSGHSRLDFVPEHVPFVLLREAFHKIRTFRSRANQAHLPSYNIYKLRKLVKTQSPQHSAEQCASRIIWLGPLRGRPF